MNLCQPRETNGGRVPVARLLHNATDRSDAHEADEALDSSRANAR